MAKVSNVQFIIAVGASTVDLGSTSPSFYHTLLNSDSYNTTEHLSSDFKSQLAKILASHSKLQVIGAVKNIDIKPDTVYLIPGSKFMVIQNDKIILSDKNDPAIAELNYSPAIEGEQPESSNKALQSYNEETPSSDKKFQTLNEKLQTINKKQELNIAELKEINYDLNNYFRINTTGQLFVDRDLLLKRYSPAAARQLHVRARDIGRPLGDLTTSVKLQTLVDDIKKVIRNAEPLTSETESVDGKTYQVMIMPYLGKNRKKADGVIISFYDITELKKLLRKLDTSNKRLTKSVQEIRRSRETIRELLEKEREVNKLNSRFVSLASHEIKTPLTSIQLSAEMISLQSPELNDPAIKKYVKNIQNSVKNLTGIVNNFLSLELLENGKINIVMMEFDIITMAEEITADMLLLAKPEQQILFTHTGTGRKVTLNQSLLKNCIINLISNAIKYSGDRSIIEFGIKMTNTYFVVMVKDNGIGIPKDEQKHLFEPFFRASNTGNIKGTGLGLNIVNRYVELMNGEIRFNSKPATGTEFSIIFPLSQMN